MTTPKKKASTSWGQVADWYNEVVSDQDSYQQAVILPNLLRGLAPKKGQRIVDVGCGTGFFSRAFAEVGATVVGADIGAELIAVAKKQSPTIEYHVASAEAMPFLKDASQDSAVIILALQNMAAPAQVLAECARVLKPGGTLHLVLNHPAFRIPQASSWGWDEKTNVQYRRVDQYLSEAKVKMQMHPGSDPTDVTWSFHRPLQFYFKALQKSGLAVLRLEEWVSHTRTPHGPRAGAENRARAEFPLFMYLTAVKLG